MRAPVYRAIDSGESFLGLPMPGGVGAVAIAFVAGFQFLPPGLAILCFLGAYVVIVVATSGKSAHHYQHLLALRQRRARHRGFFSPAARASIPQFPFETRRFRDVPPRVEASDGR